MNDRASGAIRRLGIVGHPRYDGFDAVTAELQSFADGAGLELVPEESLRSSIHADAPFDPTELDLLLALGGDGTLLRGARRVAEYHTPVLGVNLGNLGFLTTVSADELTSALRRVLAGEYWLDTRFTLEARVVDEEGREREQPFVALNDAVLHKGGFARVIHIAVSVGDDQDEIGTYSADGIILSTPTGSTAYSLSAGGPVVVPSVDCILATPICPHMLAVRPLVLPASTVVAVEILSPSSELILTVDGQDGAQLEPGEKLVVRRGDATVPLVRFGERSFFSRIRGKLNWGIERARGEPDSSR